MEMLAEGAVTLTHTENTHTHRIPVSVYELPDFTQSQKEVVALIHVSQTTAALTHTLTHTNQRTYTLKLSVLLTRTFTPQRGNCVLSNTRNLCLSYSRSNHNQNKHTHTHTDTSLTRPS